MNDQRFHGWFEFSAKRLGVESRIIAVVVPFLAQVIIISDAVEIIFPPDALGLLGMHLAYWGALLFSLAIAVGGLVIPDLVKHWDREEQLSDYAGKPHVQKLISALSMQTQRVFLNELEKTEFIVQRENESRAFALKSLKRALWFSQLMVGVSSAITAIRVGLTILS